MIFKNTKIMMLRLKRSKEKRKLNQLNKPMMFAWLKKIFNSNDSIQKDHPIDKTLNEIDVFDTVWIKDTNDIYEGWIFEKTKKRLVIVSGSKEYIVYYTRPLTQTEIKFNNKVLYFNKPC